MSDMQKSMWWCFLLTFAGINAGIYALGYWARLAAAQSCAHEPLPASVRMVRSESTHWRDLMIHDR